jgi:hypothetical protein
MRSVTYVLFDRAAVEAAGVSLYLLAVRQVFREGMIGKSRGQSFRKLHARTKKGDHDSTLESWSCRGQPFNHAEHAYQTAAPGDGIAVKG